MKDRAQKFFGCDIRSLAIFRIALACIIFCDVCDRFQYVDAFYSVHGFFNLELAKHVSPYSYSVNYLSDSIGFQKGVFILLGLGAVLLGMGCYSRLATCVCWILLASIHVRNPTVLISGDTLLRMMLFWSMFIPLGRIWSIDHWRQRRASGGETELPTQPSLLCSVGTACLILQVCIMYWTAGLSKWNEAWLDGTAMEYILRLDCYTRPMGRWALTYPMLVMCLTYSTLAIELLFPLLLFVPYRNDLIRLGVVLFFWCFHIGIEFFMDIGKFGAVSMMAWLPVLPGIFWNHFSPTRIAEPDGGSKSEVSDHTKPSSIRIWGKRVFSILVPFVFLVYVVMWNLLALHGYLGRTRRQADTDSFYRFGMATMVGQNFQMFCVPSRANATYVFNGRMKNGIRMDLVRDQPVQDSAPGGSSTGIVRGWKTLHWYLVSFGGDPKLNQSLLEYHTRTWNLAHAVSEQVYESRMECYYEEIGPGVPAGSFEHLQNLAFWARSGPIEKSKEELIQDFDQLMNQFEDGYMFPSGNE